MSKIDLIFEGGGAKGMVFAGALEVLFDEAGHTHGRLIGTSAGAITAATLAAGYSPAEMLAALEERDAEGKPIFTGFMGKPEPFPPAAVQHSAVRNALGDLRIPLLPGGARSQVADWIAERLANGATSRHIFSFIERGGWYSADPFLRWMEQRLDQPRPDGSPRAYSRLTLAEFFDATGVELTLVGADTTSASVLLLNHRTAPDLPVVWAVRMSMSIPLLWQEVVWQAEWGPYSSWKEAAGRLVPQDVTGHAIVDGGLLSNFPIALLLADRPDVSAVVGPPQVKNVLGLLIDESLPVLNRPLRQAAATGGGGLGSLQTVQRLRRLANTATGATDNMTIAAFGRHVVRLPAQGYGTTQFDMTDAERGALVEGGRQAMRAFLAAQSVLEVGAAEPADAEAAFAPHTSEMALANTAALGLLGR